MWDMFDTPTFELNADNGPLMNRVAVSMMILCFVATILRFLARRLVGQPLFWDDWMILVAVGFTWVTCIWEIIAVATGEFGRHAEFATPQSIFNFFRALFVVQITYLFAIAAVKFSILLFYRRMFDIPKTKIPLLIMAGIVAAWLIATVVVGVFSCSPIDGFWDKTKPSKCIPNVPYYLAVAIPNIITDVCLIIFPLPLFWSLKISRPQKFALSGMILLGGFIVIVSCLRLVSLIQANDNLDFTWGIIPLGIWTAIETSVGIVCACLPSMRPLFRLILRRNIKTTITSSENSEIPASRRYWSSKRVATFSDNKASFIILNEAPSSPDKVARGPKTTIRAETTDNIELGDFDGKPGNGIHRDITWH